jgi:wobble nucleotide-excising tRNase
MLKKILKIKHVGLFNDAKFTSDNFNKATLIYAENGRGKSTLASIFRSCAANDAASISLRQTLGNNSAQEIQLLFENGTSPTQTTFNGSIWSNHFSDILVFDTEFVDKNVYSGSVVGTNHRQELLEFALGEDAVQLKQKVDSEAQKASESTKEISAIEKSLASHRNGMLLEAFASLESDLDVDQKIESLSIRLAAAKNNAVLQKKSCPEQLIEPSLDLDAFFVILFTTLGDIEKNAEETVHTHISKNPNENFEAWLSEGQSFENADDCPYCGQSILEIDLLTAYKTHFNQEYVDLKTKIAHLSQDVEKWLSDTVINELFYKVESNQAITDAWSEHIQSQRFEFDKDTLLNILGQIRNLLQGLTQSKQQNPLELIGSDNDRNQAKELWNKILRAVEICNKSISIATEKIILFKGKLANENIQNLQKELSDLNLLKTRQGQTVCDLIQQWNALKAVKQIHEQEKANA